MNNKLSLKEYCRTCENICCEGYTTPYLNSEEKDNLGSMFGMQNLAQENGFWVPRKKDNQCVFLYNNLCKIELTNPRLKPVDCKIYPLDAMFVADGNLEWVIDVVCPAADQLTPEYYANAIIIGMEWIKKANSKIFMVYWEKYKENNPDQDLFLLTDYLPLPGKPEQFIAQIRKALGQKMPNDPLKWLKNNRSESLAKILKSSEIIIF